MVLLRYVVVLSLLSCSIALPTSSKSEVSIDIEGEQKFVSWMAEHRKSYPTLEHRAAALSNFLRNDALLPAMNSDPSDGAVYGHTRFSDMSPEEFASRYLPRAAGEYHPEAARANSLRLELDAASPAPASFDWREHNAVTPVKDQGSCGSCWAFSAVQNVEGLNFLQHGNASGASSPTPLSVAQVVECDPHDYACYGGFPVEAFTYIKEAGGLAAEADYPYKIDGKTICLANQTFNETCGDGMCDDPPLTSYCDETCSAQTKTLSARIKGYSVIGTDEDQIAAALAATGPLSVGLDAGGTWGIIAPWLQFYKSGVANPKSCSSDPKKIDHAVLLVGYGTDGSSPYWLVKNSWGAKWGEAGYFRLARGAGKCAINQMVSTAVMA